MVSSFSLLDWYKVARQTKMTFHLIAVEKLVYQHIILHKFLFTYTITYDCLGVTTSEITNLAAETCAYMAIVHPEYTKLANAISVKNLHKRTHDCILKVADQLYT